MKCFIISNNGFIGKNIEEKMKQFFQTYGFSSNECNLLDPDSIASALHEITSDDILIVTASITRLKENSFDSFVKNIEMINNLISFLTITPVKQIIFLSSIDIYGVDNVGVKITESLLPNPNDYYAASKISSEYLLAQFSNKLGIKIAILRLTGVFGYGDENKSTINKIVTSSEKNHVKISGGGHNKRDYLFIEDFTDIIKIFIDNTVDGVYNIATGNSHSILEIANLIVENHFPDCEIEFVENTTDENRVEHLEFDISKLREVIKDYSFTQLETAIDKYVCSFSQHQS